MILCFYRITANSHEPVQLSRYNVGLQIWMSGVGICMSANCFHFCEVLMYASNCVHTVSTAIDRVMNAIERGSFIVGICKYISIKVWTHSFVWQNMKTHNTLHMKEVIHQTKIICCVRKYDDLAQRKYCCSPSSYSSLDRKESEFVFP
jgi:hypothetical protein